MTDLALDLHRTPAGSGRRLHGPAHPRRDRLRIAMLAPPWISIPPAAYGGIENVIALLSDELVRRGHAVTLLAAPGTRSAAAVKSLLERAHPDEIGAAIHEVDHVARAFAHLDAAARRGEPFDVLHDHCGHVALAMADRITTPVVHTIHGPLTGDQRPFYCEHGHKATLVAISQAQRDTLPRQLPPGAVVPNPIVVDDWPLRAVKDDYLLWIGRFSEVKGPHRAIEIAHRAGRRLVLAGPVQPGQEQFFATRIEPHIDGSRVRYVGEVGGPAKADLYARAAALLMPIRWQEPFGLVMTEALACGTPVLAFPEGAAAEIVLHGENGFLVEDDIGMASAVAQLVDLDPTRCRASAAERFDVSIVGRGYEAVYRRAARAAALTAVAG